ncbi:hypothetical protein C7B79_16180 [Chroococcidiopsis cubana CCALA 043]|uniref:phosphate-starvation-inducible PsiE family protein n=1 Tax=Chroococcidiopsis cubana TaxID=171392 RepID=UPI000D067E4F|nr:phosphate-starvation-inducible PsiE family protein [Chroococcidiopsis cubana]PSB62869.1 hypothetical protein C7B79_16180 [Chroococcidiopsis cubana CCALA 043]
MKLLRKLISPLVDKNTNPNFLVFVDKVEDFFAKLLTLAMLGVILFAIIDLGVTLAKELLLVSKLGNFSAGLLRIFGLFLNILIALEITQNITSYLSSHIIQIEMVIVTSLIAIARKIIILDLGKITDTQLLALAAAIIALSICYWLVRRTNAKYPPHKGH